MAVPKGRRRFQVCACPVSVPVSCTGNEPPRRVLSGLGARVASGILVALTRLEAAGTSGVSRALAVCPRGIARKVRRSSGASNRRV